MKKYIRFRQYKIRSYLRHDYFKNIKKYLFILLVILFLTPVFASEQKERIYLIQLLNQLDAMQPIILAAEREQPKNLRIQFHYTKFVDGRGQSHNGLLEDVQAMRKGIEDQLNHERHEPRFVVPITGDYTIEKGNS